MIRWLVVVCVMCGCGRGAPAVEPLDFSRVGEPFGPLAHVRLGMTMEEVRRVAPDLVVRKGLPDELELWNDAGIFNVGFTRGHVGSMLVMPKPNTLRALHAAWGAGIRTAEDRVHYVDAAHTMRVMLADEMSLEFLPLVPFATMIGSDSHAFRGVVLLGRKLDEAVADLSAHAIGHEVMNAKDGIHQLEQIPPTEWTDGRSALVLQSDDRGVIHRWQWFARFDETPEAKAAILAQLDKLWGAPKVDQEVRVYGTDPEVTVLFDPATIAASIK